MAIKKTKQQGSVELPAELLGYYKRIGAEALNFRRAMVREYHSNNYYVEKTFIKITSDYEIECSRKEHDPTKEEREAIKIALDKIEFPKSIGATPQGFAKWLQSTGKNEENVFQFIDQKDGTIKMAQERWVDKSGIKHYLPWTLWSDGQWRQLEPDGALPFWKPFKEISKKIMIHEGGKAARFVHNLLHNPEFKKLKDAHPWTDELIPYTHWGIIGGALAPHRADYSEIQANAPTSVIYFCDNDLPGLQALQMVSRFYGESLKGIMLDKRWPMSWDCADDMPKNLFAGRRFIGPSLSKMTVPATRATELVPNPEGKGRPIAVMRRAFKEEWLHCVTPEIFVHRDWANQVLTTQEFNNAIRPFSDVDDTARLLRVDLASKSAVLKYDPGKKSGIYGSGDSGRYINTHKPTDIRPEEGNVAPFIDFMENFIPSETDRHEVMRWCATLIARPEIRMHYGILAISEVQGVGKGTLGEKILAPLVGETNVSYPSEKEIVDSNFNYWLAHKRLAVVHEIYAGHSAKAYNTLKTIITDKNITVSKKYMANYEVQNFMHVFACSNSMRAIQLSVDDRRWLVPKITDEKRPADYWSQFNRWLNEEGGLGIIKWWADEYVKKHKPVATGDSSPWTALKREVIEEGYSPGQMLVAQMLDRVREEAKTPSWIEAQARSASTKLTPELWRKRYGADFVVLDTDFVKMIKNVLYDGRQSDRLEKPLTVRKIAKSREMHINDVKVSVPSWGIHGGSSRLISTSVALAKVEPGELAKDIKPIDVVKLAQDWNIG